MLRESVFQISNLQIMIRYTNEEFLDHILIDIVLVIHAWNSMEEQSHLDITG